MNCSLESPNNDSYDFYRWCIQYKIMLYVDKCLYNLAPGYLSKLKRPSMPTGSLRSESAFPFTAPVTKTDCKQQK